MPGAGGLSTCGSGATAHAMPSPEDQERLAEALRANLRRRKAQARARAADPATAIDEAAGGSHADSAPGADRTTS